MTPKIGDKLFFAKRDNSNIHYIKEVIVNEIEKDDCGLKIYYNKRTDYYPSEFFNSDVNQEIEYVFLNNFFLTKEEAKNHILRCFEEKILNLNDQIENAKLNIKYIEKDIEKAKKI